MKQENQAPVLSSEDIRSIAEIGFMACGAGNISAARNIFEGLRVLRPDQAFVYIGLALTSMSLGAHQEAVDILRNKGLTASPDDDELKVFLGMALGMANRQNESQRVLSDLAGASTGTAAQKLAQRLLQDRAQDSAQAPTGNGAAGQAPGQPDTGQPATGQPETEAAPGAEPPAPGADRIQPI